VKHGKLTWFPIEAVHPEHTNVTDDIEQETEVDTDDEVESTAEAETDDDVVVDLDAAEAYEQRVDQLQETVEAQQEQIEKLEALLLDLSVRAADDRGLGVCPECHGPVEKVGARGRTKSVYVRDPDGNLVEIGTYGE
jgi:catechol 2,3-dioxygenase-like lactoylglutathione lyase family enzyme